MKTYLNQEAYVNIANSFFNLLQPAPHIEKIQDCEVIKKKYKYWRLRIFYSMYFGYVFYYFTRKSFTFAAAAMKRELGFDEVDIGMIGTIFALTYGISKFTCGVISDRSNPRYFMGIGLIMTGICNVFFGLFSSLTLLAIFWGLNGWFQGTGWPPSARLLTHWYSQSERGRWWGVWNTSHNLGGALIPIVAAAFAQYLGWRYALYFPGMIGIFVGFLLLNRLRDTPQSLGLPVIEKYRNDYSMEEGVKKDERELSVKEILFGYVLTNKYIWILAVSYFFIYIVRQAINDWTFLYFTEVKGYTDVLAGSCVCWFEVGGFLGSLAAGWGSDWVFKGKRGPINVLFSAGLAIAVAFLWIASGKSAFVDSALIFVIGFFVFGPQMLIGVAAAEVSHKKAAATATGFAGLFAYLGAAMAALPLGMVIRDMGWDMFFIVLGACSVIAAILLFPLWSIRGNPKFLEENV